MSVPIRVDIEHLQNFQFLIDFNKDDGIELITDEAPPLGEGKGAESGWFAGRGGR